jgi:16S rRNA processing protein RimM
VKNLQQVDFGQVKEVFATGANDVLVVQQGEQERLIPFIEQVVLDVSMADHSMIVDWDADF